MVEESCSLVPQNFSYKNGRWWDGVVGVATVYTVRGSNLCSDKRFFSSPTRPDRLWGPPSLLCSVYRGSYPILTLRLPN
jgi:hypothetical protein